MHKKDNQVILKRFITKEIEKVYKKYNTITVEEADLVGRFIEKIERNQIDYDPHLDYNITKTLAEENKVDLLRLYVFLTSDLNIELNIEEVKEFYYKLVDNGYVEIDECLIYYDYREEELGKMAEEKLAYDLEDAEKVMELFDEEEGSRYGDRHFTY